MDAVHVVPELEATLIACSSDPGGLYPGHIPFNSWVTKDIEIRRALVKKHLQSPGKNRILSKNAYWLKTRIVLSVLPGL